MIVVDNRQNRQIYPKAAHIMQDIIEINQLEVKALIGVAPWEQQVPQKLRLDIHFPVDGKLAATDDDIRHTCDYSVLSQSTIDFCASHPFRLLETLAEALCQHLLTDFSVEWITLRIQKTGAVLAANHVALQITRPQKA